MFNRNILIKSKGATAPLLFLIALFLLNATGCSQTQLSSEPDPANKKESAIKPTTKPETPPSVELHATGEIVYKGLEGGFFAFYSDDGKHYYPLNLEEEFKRSGLRVEIRAVLKPMVRTIAMHGTPIEIIDIQLIGRTPPKDDRQ